jgi:hypothetical protein
VVGPDDHRRWGGNDPELTPQLEIRVEQHAARSGLLTLERRQAVVFNRAADDSKAVEGAAAFPKVGGLRPKVGNDAFEIPLSGLQDDQAKDATLGTIVGERYSIGIGKGELGHGASGLDSPGCDPLAGRGKQRD